MKSDREGEADGVLTDHQLGRLGLRVKLDKGFEDGTYCVYVEYDDLAERIGFAAAHRSAVEFCRLLKGQLQQLPGYDLGRTEDASRTGDRSRRKHDLEATFLSFPVQTHDERFHDDDMRKHFRVAFLRAGQAREQAEALEQTQRRHTKQDRFRQQFAALLDGEAYAGLDPAVRERLLAEVPGLAFPPRGVGP
jgi:hypothetical protein